MGLAAGLTWGERRILAIWQDRYGPNRVGPFGVLQVVADTIKILMKEDWVPPFADRFVFILAPAVMLAAVLLPYAVLVFAPGLAIADLNVGILFFLGMSSLAVYGAALAGWASNSKYSLLGSLRAMGQMISYEVFMGLALMGVVILTGSFRIGAIVEAQRGLWFFIPQAPGLAAVPDRRHGGDAPHALRPARGGQRAGGRLPHRVLRHEVRAVLLQRVHRDDPRLRADLPAVLRGLAGARFPAPGRCGSS